MCVGHHQRLVIVVGFEGAGIVAAARDEEAGAVGGVREVGLARRLGGAAREGRAVWHRGEREEVVAKLRRCYQCSQGDAAEGTTLIIVYVTWQTFSLVALMEFVGSKAQGDAPERAKISCSLFVKFGLSVGSKGGGHERVRDLEVWGRQSIINAPAGDE